MEMAKHESHWTSELVEQVSVDAADEPTELGLSDIPNSQVLTLPHRVIEFGASLLSNKAQLRLNITKGVGSRLGIIAGDASTVFASAWAGTLIVWSEEFFASATNQPI
ncbi:MAG: hypothetical protein H6981_06205 [Gammaproteobacteria bacterium]|nr:hypothetical protein [Gammaproteobacteria bacterium]MCP5136376.1 hypothetical protein [Gammaproteobacteria bacterium]